MKVFIYSFFFDQPTTELEDLTFIKPSRLTEFNREEGQWPKIVNTARTSNY